MRTAICLESAAPLTWEVLASLRFWKKLCISALCFVASTGTKSAIAQNTSRAAQFKAAHAWSDPLRIEPRLSGNFGELRGNHFHTGVDLKTEGREGLVVIAATDGQVSRVKMSPWGYGNALYLDGPDGVTTVYAHLQRFAPKVQAWAVERTYAVRSLGLDASPSASAGLHFQAGDTLGWSGNSGGSGGPHLHFEIRSTANQHPLNPLDGWLDKVDTRPPVLPVLWVESPTTRMRVALPVADTLVLPGKARFAIEGYDLLDGASNICGLRTLEAEVTSAVDEVLLTHRASWDELDFGVNKDMNAHAFFPVWSTERDQVHRLHRFPTNRLGIYTTPPSEGWVELLPGTGAELRVRATDAAGNETEVIIPLVGGLAEKRADDVSREVDGLEVVEWSVNPKVAGTKRSESGRGRGSQERFSNPKPCAYLWVKTDGRSTWCLWTFPTASPFKFDGPCRLPWRCGKGLGRFCLATRCHLTGGWRFSARRMERLRARWSPRNRMGFGKSTCHEVESG